MEKVALVTGASSGIGRAVAAALAERWYDARAGARSLRRALAKEVEQRLARQMLCGGEGDFLLDARDGSLVLTAPAGAGV